jgi:hypothetical protein
MDGWLGGALGWLCGALGVAKFLLAGWCILELWRKGRSVPELWSIDWLDIVYRLKREFGVTIAAGDFEG